MMNWHRSGRGCIDGVCFANERQLESGTAEMKQMKQDGACELRLL
jgi:hypothetical protein